MKPPYFPQINMDKLTQNTLFDIQIELAQNPELRTFINQNVENYYSWDKFSHLPIPSSRFNAQQLWTYLKVFCRPKFKETPLITDKIGTPFWYSQTDRISKSLHQIDKSCSGNPLLNGYDIDPHYKEEWAKKRVITSLVEESIGSSLIEGAATTRRKAKELLRSGAKPKNKDEKMVLNNYRTITLIQSTFIHQEASIALILDIQRELTKEVIDPKDIGRLREDLNEEDKVVVYDDDGYTVLHEPPAAASLYERMENLCRFINHSEPFIHPIIKAIMIHFAIGYIHPFYDGNGRVARGLFYWYLLRQGYKIFEFISISEQINKGLGQYKRAYLNTEKDDNDLTYFIYYHLGIIEQSLDSLKDYLHKKLAALKNLKNKLRDIPDINNRQLDLLNHALKHIDDDQRYTIESHQNANGIAYGTARDDLFKLSDRGFLEKRKLGKKIYFYIPQELLSKIDHATSAPVIASQ